MAGIGRDPARGLAKSGHGAKGPASLPEALQTLDTAESIRSL